MLLTNVEGRTMPISAQILTLNIEDPAIWMVDMVSVVPSKLS